MIGTGVVVVVVVSTFGLHDAGATNFKGGQAAAGTLLGRPDRPTAIVTANDMQALGVYQAAREAGLRVPADLSVVGFDGVPFAVRAGLTFFSVSKYPSRPLASAVETFPQLFRAVGRNNCARSVDRPPSSHHHS